MLKVHHISDKAERILPKFFVRKATAPRSLPYTFEPNGFYRKFKERAREALKDVDYHSATNQSKIIADFIATTTIALAIASAIFKSWIIVIACGNYFPKHKWYPKIQITYTISNSDDEYTIENLNFWHWMDIEWRRTVYP